MSKVEQVKKVMDEVYGLCTDPRTWMPKKYKDTKSRYLWTDAFGVCNYITLFCETQDAGYLAQADALISDVHDTLGKDRALKHRLGKSTDDRPLLGGLRIGKEDPEGYPDGDGQYFHYLTKWMFALSRMSLVKKDMKYNNWAVDLAKVAHDKFIKGITTDHPRMFWKMSIDLSYPHVDSEGNLDPFDGYVTYRAIQEVSKDEETLKNQIKTFEKMVIMKYPRYRSSDPLDLGEALWITHLKKEEEWARHVAKVSLASLEVLWDRQYFNMPEQRRLAFREFGTTIGVQVHPLAHSRPPSSSPLSPSSYSSSPSSSSSSSSSSSPWNKRVDTLHDFWAPKIYKRDHDISPVMYCTSLIPGCFWNDYPKLSTTSAP